MIKNKTELVTNKLRVWAVDILEAGIHSVLPGSIMHSSIKYEPVSRILSIRDHHFNLAHGRLFVIGGGKASAAMSLALENIVGPENITAGVVSDKYGALGNTRTIQIRYAGHPIPDANGVEAVQQMLSLKEKFQISYGDVVICLISGGGSALMPYPVDGVDLEDKKMVTTLLLSSGADIFEINCIRKHLSKIKGGQLGQYFAPALVISLVLSDVIGNDLSVIASGVTYPDSSSFQQSLDIIEKYRLSAHIPDTIITHLKRGAAGLIEENPRRLDNCFNYIIGDNQVALTAMKAKAIEFGLHPVIITAEQKGETGIIASQRASEIKHGKHGVFDAFILGGETTPVLPPKHGQGGRNQHYVAVSLLTMQDQPKPWLVASLGTDGSDFLPEVAGAVADDTSLDLIHSLGLPVGSYIEDYDSYNLFTRLPGTLIRTGSTGTNVGDIIIYLVPGQP